MLKLGAYVIAGCLLGAVSMWYWDKSNEYSQNYQMYGQLSSDALIALTPSVLERWQRVVGVLRAWKHSEDDSSFILVPDKSWLNVNIDLIPNAIVMLRSTTDDESPMVASHCLDRFVMVQGLARQSLGTMSLFDIYEILLVEGQDNNQIGGMECLANKPSPASLHDKMWERGAENAGGLSTD